MPEESAVSSTKAKPTTRRSSIRQSLNLASVSKAFAEVINKDNKDTNKHAKGTKESRRLSTANPTRSATPRTSMGDTRSPSQATVRTVTPESRTSGRKRMSVQRASPTEQSGKCDSAGNTPITTTGVTTRAATLRARNMNTTASSLPKYRPKSVIAEPSKQSPSSSAIRIGTRRRFSTSDDEKLEKAMVADSPVTLKADKGARPISPLPQRAARRSSNTLTPTPPTGNQVRTRTPPVRGSPARPSKTVKTTTTAPHPPSSSSSSSITPPTPSTPKSNIRFPRQDKNKQRPAPDSTSSNQSSDSPSPPSRHARFMHKASPVMGNMSHISEGSSEDEDDEDEEAVEMLLAPVADITAPTPTMPRIQKMRPRRSGAPKTPTRAVNQLPTRANMSYLSPMPPGDNSLSIRPPQPCQKSLSARNAGRGSILSWEQLASEASKTLGEDELEKMLADIPAPFQSGVASPALSANLEIPESPCLSTLDSPSGYGSISQVLLPDATPSPAMHASQRFTLLSSEDTNTFDSPTVTLLRLQLAQAENIARQRLMQMQAMEQEIYSLQDAHVRQMQETTRQIEYLEANQRKGEESMSYLSSLENQIRQMESHQREAIDLATQRCEERARRSFENEKRKERFVIEARAIACVAKSEWLSVKDLSEIELDFVQGDQAVLTILLTELDHLAQTFVL